MHLKVTPVDGQGGVAAVAGAVVAYLEGAGTKGSPGKPLLGPDLPGEGRTVAYYADSIEGTGQWWGQGAGLLDLEGEVEAEAFQRVLEGRHPVTGERLLSARGSAGRWALKVGQPTRRAADGEPVYDLRDAATAVDLSIADIEELAEVANRRGDDLGTTAVDSAETGRWLDTEILDGIRVVRDSELDRLAGVLAAGVTADTVRTGGPANEQLTVKTAAHLIGVEPRYLRRLCRDYETNRTEIDTAIADGRTPTRAFVRGQRLEGDERRPWRITRDELASFVERRRQPAVRVGYDLTLTTEKSVGVAMMLSDGDRQDQFVEALAAANNVALNWMESHAAFTRRKGQRVGTEGLVVASYLHGTSRALDPHPHHHNVVANAAVDAYGDRKALDARALYRQARSAGALATAELRWQLATQLGVGWRRSSRGGWEIGGVSDDVTEEFSSRRTEIEAALSELADELKRPLNPYDYDRAAIATRGPKEPTNRDELIAGWWRRAKRRGLSRRGLERCFFRRPPPRPTLSATEKATLFDWLAGPDGVTAQSSLFDRGDVITAMVNYAPPTAKDELMVLPAHAVEALADQFLCSERVIELPGSAGRSTDVIARQDGHKIDNSAGEPVFTTVAMARTQNRIVQRFTHGLAAGVGVVDGATLDAVLTQRTELTGEQLDMVVSICTSGARHQCVVGHPGAGKTHAIGAAVEAWRADGYTVVGAAVKGDAALLLGKTADIQVETLAWYLTQADRGDSVLDQRTVLVVDESSTIGDLDLDKLLHLVETTGATLRLVGDSAQHGSVPAGGMFRVLTDQYPTLTPQLTKSMRLRDPADQQAATAIREGRTHDALQILDTAGKITVADTLPKLHAAMMRRWMTSRSNGKPHPMVDRRNAVRHSLNTAAHKALQNTGEVAATGVAAIGDREFCVGDEVVARQPARGLHPKGDPCAYVRNDARGQISAISRRDVLVIDFDELGRIDVPRSYYDEVHRDAPALDWAYAVTSYSVQGSTFINSTSAITPASSRAEAYVDLTRAIEDNHAFLAEFDTPETNEGHLPTDKGDRDLPTAIANALAASGPEKAAWDLDPKADLAAAQRQGRTLPSLDAEHRRLLNERHDDEATIGVARRATVLAEAAVARAARRTPPPWITDSLPARPDTPWMATLWDNAVAAAAVYLERWTDTRTKSEEAPWSCILGSNGRSDRQQDEREIAVNLLTKATLAIVRRDLANHAPQPETDAVEDPLPDLDAQDTPSRPTDTAVAVADARQALEVAVANESQAHVALAEARKQVSRLSRTDRRRRRRDRPALANARLALRENASNLSATEADRDRRENDYLDAATAHDRAEISRTPSIKTEIREAHLRHATLTDPPAWLGHHLHSLAEKGRAGNFPARNLARLYGDIAIYRERYQLPATNLDVELATAENTIGLRPAQPGIPQRDWDQISPQIEAALTGATRGLRSVVR